MIQQRFIVMLDDTAHTGRQVFLAYNDLGRIGNGKYSEAFRYETHHQASRALAAVRRLRAWPRAKILGTCIDTTDD